jgi:hypothetical protein
MLGDPMEIVFVHLGIKFPKHLILNLKRTCELFPGFNVVLLTDVSTNIKIDKKNFRKSFIEMSSDYQSLDNNLIHPKSFRHNFWFTSLARLYALCDYVISNQVSILHIESDVLVSADLPVERFAKCDRPIAFTVVGEGSGVASVLWIENTQAANHLKEYSAKSAWEDPMTTDMKILGHFQQDYPQLVRVLASFPTEIGNSFKSLPSQILEDFNYTTNLFGGFFDAADVGRYLLGDDPRNHRGVKLLRKELDTSYFRPKEVGYVYSDSRGFLGVQSDSINRYFSLHIHSKNVKVFKRNTMRRVLLRAIRNQGKGEGRTFVALVLINAIQNSLRRRLQVLLAGR